MSQPKEPYSLPKISCKMLRCIRPGESVIVGPCNPSQVSAEMTHLRPMKFVQQKVIVVEPRTVSSQRMFCVTRFA